MNIQQADSIRVRLRPIIAALAASAALWGCAAQQAHRQGLDQLAKGERQQGLANLKRASDLEIDNLRYRVDFLAKKEAVVNDILLRADAMVEEGAVDEAATLYRQAIQIEPGNARGIKGLQRIDVERKALTQLALAERYLSANQVDQAAEIVRKVSRDAPRSAQVRELTRRIEERQEAERLAREEKQTARAAFRRPVTLSFRDTPLKMVFEAFSRVGNINIVVDSDVRSDIKTTIFVRDAAIEDALDIILLQNKLEKRVLNNNSVLVYPATQAKQRELAELKVRAFRLSNVDATGMANTIKSMLKTRDVTTDAVNNTLIMRDTPDAIALAEKIIAATDLPDPEVMLEVSIMEVSATRVSELGLKLPTAVTVSTPTTGGGTIGELRALTRDNLLISPLSATLNLLLQDSDTSILAAPRIRARNKEKARILVGDKLPQITNLLTPQQAGVNSVLTGSVTYVDVGIKLEVEPQVYGDDDVGIKLNLEVSNVTDTVQTISGRAYQIGTRSTQTNLRLRDGETQVLGGLIGETDRRSAQKVPGLGQMPVVGRLFSNNSGNRNKTEIILSITPHIIRHVPIADIRNADVWTGTETTVRDRPLRIDPVGGLNANPAQVQRAGAVTVTPRAPDGSIRAIPAPAGVAPSDRGGPLPAVPPGPGTGALPMSVPVLPPAPSAAEATSMPMTPPSGLPVVVPRSVGPRTTQPTIFGTEPTPPESDSTSEPADSGSTPSKEGGEGAAKQ